MGRLFNDLSHTPWGVALDTWAFGPGATRTVGGSERVEMAERKDKKVPEVRDKPRKKSDAAFDLWLHRGLHQLYDNIANEPVPEALLRLIEEDREK